MTSVTLEDIKARKPALTPADVNQREPEIITLADAKKRRPKMHTEAPPTVANPDTTSGGLNRTERVRRIFEAMKQDKIFDPDDPNGIREKTQIERAEDLFGRVPEIRARTGPTPLRRRMGKFARTDGVDLGIADFAPGTGLALAIDDVKRDMADEASGLDVDPVQKYANRVAAVVGLMTLGVGAGFVKAGAKAGGAAGKSLVAAYREGAQKVLDKVYDKFGHKISPLGTVPEKRKYLGLRYRTLGKIGEVDKIAKMISKTFSGATEADQKAAYVYLTTKDMVPDGIKSPQIRAAAVETKQAIDEIGQALVKRGMLSQVAYDAHKGEYLPRVYLKHLLERDSQGFGGKKISGQGYLKKRGDIPEDVRRIMLGEVDNVGYVSARALSVPAHDLVMDTFLSNISKNTAWANPNTVAEWNGRNVSTKWLYEESTRLKTQAAYYDDATRTDALRVADEMDSARAQAEELMPVEHAEFKAIPDDPRYGPLRGMEVHTDIADDIEGAVGFTADPTSVMGKLYRGAVKANRLWKLVNVAMNPPTQVRNFLSNAILLNLGGVPIAKVPGHIVGAIRDMRTGGEAWKVAQEYGVSATTFSRNELLRIEEEMLNVLAKSGHKMDHVRYLAGVLVNKAGDLYQLSESVFKTAMIRHMLGKGASKEDAALAAHKALFDYSLVPPTVRNIRNAPIGSPFLTFMYKSMGQMAEVAVKHPERYLPYAAADYAMTKLIEEEYDVSAEDVKKLRQSMADWMRHKGNVYILPVKDANRKWQALDVGYIMPWGQLNEALNTMGDADARGLLKDTGLFGGPLPQIISAIQTNIDPFTERPIANPIDPPARQLADLVRFAWRMAAPTWLTDIGVAGKLIETLAHDTDRYGEPTPTVAQAALRGIGINVYPLDPELTQHINIKRRMRKIAEAQSRGDYLLKDETLSPEQKDAIREEYVERIFKMRDELNEYRKTSEVPEKLRVAR